MTHLSAIGIVCIITYTYLFKGIREFLSEKCESKFWGIFYHLIICPYCLGFWAGISVYWINNYPISEIIFYSFSSSFLSGLSVHLINFLKRK